MTGKYTPLEHYLAVLPASRGKFRHHDPDLCLTFVSLFCRGSASMPAIPHTVTHLPWRAVPGGV